MTPPQADSIPMPDQELGELVTYLARSSRMTAAEARRAVDEVLAFMNETPEEFIRRRHLALQAQGHSNTAIFQQIARELAQRRFRAPDYTERQIRRVIYG
jgi:thioesterase domain-containing protein